MLLALFLGFSAGLLTTVPLAGPASALIFSMALRGRRHQARFMALGAATAELTYANLAYFGFSRFLKDLPVLAQVSSIVAAIILTAVGLYFYKNQKLREIHESEDNAILVPWRSFLLGLGLGGGNLTLLATWTAALALIYSLNLFEITGTNFFLFSLSFAIGVVAWFFILVKLVQVYKSQFEASILDRILKGVGVFLMGLGLWMFVQGIRVFF